ncbi:hypothetical protein F5890DRAFT_1553105 [Lentinula detonsa]|uniref:Uncharacterized protein n=1 Tax=Lentinula detonsa TaxID=2804962 RepID=A0AA38UT43_9AGAR|nr:hypothetical protein F5890DRAFT_1553105 [Lentinula detonsa]
MYSPQKLTSSEIAAQLCQMQEQLLAAQEEERMEAEQAKRVAEEKVRREAEEEEKKRQEKKLAEKKRRIEEAKRAKVAQKREDKKMEDISDPSDPPYQEESTDDDSGWDEELKAPKHKKRKGNNAQPIASTSSARPPCTRKSKVHCSWNNRIKSNPIVGEASLPTDFCERIAGAMEGIQELMFGIAYGLRQFRLQVGSWEDTLLLERSHRARRGEKLEALEIERELEELREEEE